MSPSALQFAVAYLKPEVDEKLPANTAVQWPRHASGLQREPFLKGRKKCEKKISNLQLMMNVYEQERMMDVKLIGVLVIP